MNLKYSFEPICDHLTEKLILGTLPGERSLQMNQYYAHPQNQFWKILFLIFEKELTTNYKEKIQMLIENRIGLWDVVHSAERITSLDSHLIVHQSNELDYFINRLPHLKSIAFNGKKAFELFKKHFPKLVHAIPYTILPSTSPANASIAFHQKLNLWRHFILE